MTEVIRMAEAFDGHEKVFVSFDDELAADLPNARLIPNAIWPGITSLIILTWHLFFIFIKEKPDVILSTGSHIAIPAFYLGKFLFGTRLIFVECSAQVVLPSRTGKIVYPICDRFYVQWESLQKQYGNKANTLEGLYDFRNSQHGPPSF